MYLREFLWTSEVQVLSEARWWNWTDRWQIWSWVLCRLLHVFSTTQSSLQPLPNFRIIEVFLCYSILIKSKGKKFQSLCLSSSDKCLSNTTPPPLLMSLLPTPLNYTFILSQTTHCRHAPLYFTSGFLSCTFIPILKASNEHIFTDCIEWENVYVRIILKC